MPRLVALLLASAALLAAGASTSWESNTYADFLKGRFNGVSLTRDGRLTLAPALETLAATGEAGVWALAAAKDGTLYFSTGHRGRVYQLKPGAKPTLLWSAPQPEVFALTLDAQGRLYAATSPDGKIYRLENGKATEFFDPKSKYIWSLAAAPDGTIYAGTGDQGRLFRIAPSGQGELYYESGQAHITALAFDKSGRLLAGSEPNGILYRIDAPNKAFVLYDSSLPEIRSIELAPDGSLYVAALGGTLAQRQAQAASTAAAATPAAGVVTTTITVTADADSSSAQSGVNLQPKPEAAKPATGAAELPPPPPVVDLSADKAAIYRITPDNLVETLWSSREENVYSIALRASDLYFSTDQQGRIYRLSPDLKSTLLVETREAETTRLLDQPQGLVAATANLAKLFRLNGRPTAPATYESPVHDAGNAARWGRLHFRADAAPGSLTFRTRSGNSQRPDTTWSDWSQPLTANDAPIPSPNARFIQYQVELSGNAPLLDSVAISYQPQNSRPVVRSIQVTPQWIAIPQKTAAPASAAPVSYSITVTDSGDAAATTSAGTATQSVTRSGSPQIFIAWQADDPEADKLTYAVHYRAEDERAWKLLKADLADNTLLQETDIFADGRYFFRVTASDRASNSPAQSRESDLTSQPVLIDQTPPRLTIAAPRTTPQGLELDIDATDLASPIRRAEFSVNGGPWQLLDAADGVADSLTERFTARIPAAQTERTVTVRVFDSAANPGLARAILR